jgi:hypothetical protein
MRQQEYRKPLQMSAKLVAQDVRGIGQFGSYFR